MTLHLKRKKGHGLITNLHLINNVEDLCSLTKYLIIYCLWSKKIHKWKYLVYKNIDIIHNYRKKLLRVPLWIRHDTINRGLLEIPFTVPLELNLRYTYFLSIVSTVSKWLDIGYVYSCKEIYLCISYLYIRRGVKFSDCWIIFFF